MSSSMRVLSLLLPAWLACAVPVSAEVTKDAAGGVVLSARDALGNTTSRRVIHADGTEHSTRSEYWPGTRIANRAVVEDLDHRGRATRRVVQTFDRGGRELERSTVTIDAAGRESGTRTRVRYDAKGAATRESTTIGAVGR
jgi:hypothetical protein